LNFFITEISVGYNKFSFTDTNIADLYKNKKKLPLLRTALLLYLKNYLIN